MGRILRLTLLSPAIIEPNRTRAWPPGLQLEDLFGNFPIEWEGQAAKWQAQH